MKIEQTKEGFILSVTPFEMELLSESCSSFANDKRTDIECAFDLINEENRYRDFDRFLQSLKEKERLYAQDLCNMMRKFKIPYLPSDCFQRALNKKCLDLHKEISNFSSACEYCEKFFTNSETGTEE